MHVDCPSCGRRGSLADGTPLPKMVRCPGCGEKFKPGAATATLLPPAGRSAGIELDAGAAMPAVIPARRAAPAPAIAPPPPRVIEVVAPARTCDFCGETIQPSARKCRHCGETLDPALRAAEEAKRLAMHSSGQPVVINNNASASAAASASAGGYRPSLLGQFVRFVVAMALCLVCGLILIAMRHAPGDRANVAGILLVALSFLMFAVGMPIFALRGVWRLIFG